MEIDLKDLLFRLLDKRRTVKRIHDVDVNNLFFFFLFNFKIFIFFKENESR